MFAQSISKTASIGKWLCPVTLALLAAPVVAEERGLAVYKQQCAMCHGDDGQGGDGYDLPLAGSRTVAGLAKYIAKSMPEGSPEDCVADDAEAVARYVYDSFYSPIAQARIRPARIDLARLTNRQYAQSVADLVGSFRPTQPLGEARGIKVIFFNSGRRINERSRVAERTQPTAVLKSKESVADIKKLKQEEFAVRFTGGLIAQQTGEYEIILNTKNGARLWVNDLGQPLIDAWVRSGDESEYRERVRLISGRVYPIRIECFKSKNDKQVGVELKWKPPLRAAEVIPQRHLVPGQFSEVLVLNTEFPPDDRSLGYERGTFVSRQWDEATTYAAIEVARHVTSHLQELSGVGKDAPDRKARLLQFSQQFVERAFRRPLSESEKQFFVASQFADAPTPDEAVKRVVLLALKSPRFLYPRLDQGESKDFVAAQRLALGLWDSLPDERLLEAARNGQLNNPQQVSQQARRMLDDPRARAKIHEFFYQWLHVDLLEEISKDADQYPEFDERIVSDLRTSLDLFLDEIVWAESSDFRELLLAEWVYFNGRLAQFYGADLPSDADFERVVLGDEDRAGVLSHPLLMSGFAYHATSSPIHRGVFINRNLLGRVLRPPPEAVTPLDPDLHPGMTTREVVTLQTNSTACLKCHQTINPLGFALENFDAVGRFREKEKGRPIDATGSLERLDGSLEKFQGARDLANTLAASDEVHTAFVEQLFHYLVKQPIRAHGLNTSDRLREYFVDREFNIRDLIVESVTTAALHVDDSQQEKN